MNLKLLFYALRMSITKGVLQDITFVYNLADNRNTSNRAQLLSLLIPEDEFSHFEVTEDQLLSLKGCDGVDHPLFGGNTER